MKNLILFFIMLILVSCASVPNGLMQDAKTLERGEFEVNFGGGLGSEIPHAIVQEEYNNSDWQESMAGLGPLGFIGRIYEGLRFRAGLNGMLDITQELWVSFGLTNYEFFTKTRLKFSPLSNDVPVQIALAPTFVGAIGPADVVSSDTTDDDVQYSFDGFGAEMPIILSFHGSEVAAPYLALCPGFLRLGYDNNVDLELPDIVYPLYLNFNIGVQITKGMFAMAPEVNYSWAYYKGKHIYNTFGFGIAGGVRFKKRNKG